MPDKITRLPLNASAGASHRHLTEDDLRAIYSVLPENQPQLAALHQLIQQRGLTANTTLAEMEQHQGLFDRMEVFTLLGDRYPLTEQQVREGAEILASWSENPELIDSLSLEQTIALLAELIGAVQHNASDFAAISA